MEDEAVSHQHRYPLVKNSANDATKDVIVSVRSPSDIEAVESNIIRGSSKGVADSATIIIKSLAEGCGSKDVMQFANNNHKKKKLSINAPCAKQMSSPTTLEKMLNSKSHTSNSAGSASNANG